MIPWIFTATALAFDTILLSVLLNGSYKFYIQGTLSHKDIQQTGECDSAQELIQWYYSDYGNKGKRNFSRLHVFLSFLFSFSLTFPFPSLFFLIMLKSKTLNGCSKKQKTDEDWVDIKMYWFTVGLIVTGKAFRWSIIYGKCSN